MIKKLLRTELADTESVRVEAHTSQTSGVNVALRSRARRQYVADLTHSLRWYVWDAADESAHCAPWIKRRKPFIFFSKASATRHSAKCNLHKLFIIYFRFIRCRVRRLCDMFSARHRHLANATKSNSWNLKCNDACAATNTIINHILIVFSLAMANIIAHESRNATQAAQQQQTSSNWIRCFPLLLFFVFYATLLELMSRFWNRTINKKKRKEKNVEDKIKR